MQTEGGGRGAAAPGQEAVLEVAGLEASYGLARALFGVSLCAGRGEAVALLGKNGAGKSTALKAIMGLLPSCGGRVRIRGEDLTGRPAQVVCRRGVGFVPEDRRIFPDLTVRENLAVGWRPGQGVGLAASLGRVLDLFPALGPLLRRRGDRLSGGEQQMLAIGRALMGEPVLLLLDEPTVGLAPRVVAELAGQLLRLRREGLAILLAEQQFGFAARLCDRAYILEKGQLCYDGPMARLQADESLRRRYLMV
jgi:branched-chain amino acid transport system ATP-binding protein